MKIRHKGMYNFFFAEYIKLWYEFCKNTYNVYCRCKIVKSIIVQVIKINKFNMKQVNHNNV